MTDNDPFIELPLAYGDNLSIYIRRSQIVLLETETAYKEGGFLQGTSISFRLGDHTTSRFIPLSPQEVMARLDQRE